MTTATGVAWCITAAADATSAAEYVAAAAVIVDVDDAAVYAECAAATASSAAAEYAAELVRAGSERRVAAWIDADDDENAWQADLLARMLEP